MERMILWDADGVLFDTFTPEGHFRWSQNIEHDLGITPALIKKIFSDGWDDVLRGTREAIDHVTQVFDDAKFPLPPQTFIDYWLAKDDVINETVAHFLSLAPSCIASNQPRIRAERFESWFRGRVHRVFASSQMNGVMKPEDGFYDYIEKALALPPSHLCLIDDMEKNVSAARAHGWQGHHYTGLAPLTRFLEDWANTNQ